MTPKFQLSTPLRPQRTWAVRSASEPDAAPSEGYLTPYPFSVWSFHDNLPQYEVTPASVLRGWHLVLALTLGLGLGIVLWWSLIQAVARLLRG